MIAGQVEQIRSRGDEQGVNAGTASQSLGGLKSAAINGRFHKRHRTRPPVIEAFQAFSRRWRDSEMAEALRPLGDVAPAPAASSPPTSAAHHRVDQPRGLIDGEPECAKAGVVAPQAQDEYPEVVVEREPQETPFVARVEEDRTLRR